MDIAQFRLDFPEFGDTTRFPDSQVTFWSGIGEKLVNTCYWQDMTTVGVELYTAHSLTLAAEAAKGVTGGGLPGQVVGPTASKTVGQASVSYDTSTSTELNAGHWNLTTYGRQYIRLARMFGAGAVQL